MQRSTSFNNVAIATKKKKLLHNSFLGYAKKKWRGRKMLIWMKKKAEKYIKEKKQ